MELVELHRQCHAEIVRLSRQDVENPLMVQDKPTARDWLLPDNAFLTVRDTRSIKSWLMIYAAYQFERNRGQRR